MDAPTTSPVLTICDDLRVPLADYARTGLRVGIWASSGRGKSFGVGVLCEELLAAGVPVVALDPEGELFTLRERFRVLVLGGDHADLPLPSGENAIKVALTRALDEGLGLVLDLSDRPTSRSQQEAAYPFLERLWALLSERRAPAALVVEEVHVFAPQSGASMTSDILHRFAKQGRKRGVILVTASQRTQAVSKELMSQLNFQAIGGFEIERDYDAVKAIIDGHPFEELRSLPVGEFFFTAVKRFDRWRDRHTAHGGDAPSFAAGGGEPRVADGKLGALVAELRSAFAQDAASLTEAPDPTRALRAEIRRLEQRLEQAEEARRTAEHEAERMRTALQVAGVLKVVIQNEVIVAATQPPRPAATMPVAPATPQAPSQEPAPPPVATVTTTAAPATPTLRDLGLSASRLMDLPGVKALVHEARKHARRRSPKASAMVVLGAKALLAGASLNAEDLAVRSGSRSQVAIRRAVHALSALEAAGLSRLSNGRYAVNEAVVLRAVRAG